MASAWHAVRGRSRQPPEPRAAEPHLPDRRAPTPPPVTWNSACTPSLTPRSRPVRPESGCPRAGPLRTAQREGRCRPRPTSSECARPPPLGPPCRGDSQTAPPGRDSAPGSWPPRRPQTGTGRRLPPRLRPSGRPRSTADGSHIRRTKTGGYACARMTVDAPCPQPMSATVAPARSFASTPSSAGIQ
jgi:hypothetical protein